MIKVQCDIGGEQAETSGVFLPLPRMGVPFFKPELPDGWRRMEVPMPDGSAWERHACPACLRRLWELFGVPDPEAERCVACGHTPKDHEGHLGCTSTVTKVTGEGNDAVHSTGDCPCVLSPVECLDETWMPEARA